jgi:intraflagellar transport protein 172
LDGSIFKFTFPEGSEPHSHQLLTTAPFVPYCLGWGEHIVAAGNSGLVQFYDLQGGQAQSFDYSSDEKMKEFSCCGVSPSGQTVVLGNYDKFYTYVFNLGKEIWEEAGVTRVDNLYTVTAARWKSDGARLCTGSLCGAIDLYDACMRKYTYRGKYEFTYTSPSSAIIKKLSNGARMALKSKHGCEIKKINIYKDRYVIAHTTDTLMAGDMKTCELSEVPWNHGGTGRREAKESKRPGAASIAPERRKERFFFENEFAVMVYAGGELTLIEYGKSEILGSCRTEHISPHSISLRLNEAKVGREGPPVKKIAFLLDVSAVRVMDLNTGHTDATHTHESRIDWLEVFLCSALFPAHEWSPYVSCAILR